MEIPKVFISYSWSNRAHEQWVLNLATELRDNSVDVILDKWDLKEGNDKIKFMEKMVTDPDIKKVIIVSDEIYMLKADGRNGGVGTETQIISKEVYDNQEQDKFVAAVAQKDLNGKPFLPIYYKSRIYIDLSEPDSYTENFEKLLRWIYDKPLYVKPELGKRPAFLDESEGISLGTTSTFKRAISAIKESKPFAIGALDEYLEIFTNNLERFRLSDINGEFDDAVVESIEQFTPYRNEIIQLLYVIARYAPNEENMNKIHKFFESIIPYMYKPQHITSYLDWDFDNFIFIVHELFLYTIAIFLKVEKFQQTNILLTQNYFLERNSEYGRDVMVSYEIFYRNMSSLNHRNKRLALRRLSLRADILEKRSSVFGVEFKYLMQADFILFMRAQINEGHWWPETLLYIGRFYGPFEIFARSVSSLYFEKVKCLLNINQPSDLTELLESYKNGKRALPTWEFNSFDPALLLGYEQLATKV